MKVLAVGVDFVESHHSWMVDIAETQGAVVNVSILGDPDRKVSDLYGMIHPYASDTLTVRSVFFIDPNKKIRALITYPASTGRNFEEILRVIDSLQLTDKHSVATPANWKQGEDVIIAPGLTDPVLLNRQFPQGFKTLKSYLRVVAQPKD